MLLSARILKDVSNVNSFDYADVAQFTQGDRVDVYFQLIDASLDTSSERFIPAGRRYMPAVGATLSVVVENIDSAKQISRSATQPFAQDPSIWMLSILTTDYIVGTANLRFVLTEGAKVTNGSLKNAFRVGSNTCL